MAHNLDTDALATVGTVIEEGAGRDAIHIAVLPVEAQMKMFPSQPANQAGGTGDPIGIVDPFLQAPVLPGQTFWLFIYPRTITSLRHVWNHPSIVDEGLEKEAAKKGLTPAETWLQNYCAEVGMRLDELLDATEMWVLYGEHWVEGGRFEGIGLPHEFWEHYQNHTGKVVPENKQERFYCCSC
jgi:hypothetical protein